MRYLRKHSAYIDRYDLSTIRLCLMVLDVRDKMYADKKMQKKYPIGKHKHEVDKVINQQLYFLKAHEYQKKEATINKWIEDDKKIQKRYDSSISPNIRCEQCGRKFKELSRNFEGIDCLKSRIMFTLICEDCRIVKHVYENGDEIVLTLERCSKCKASVKSDCTFSDDVSTYFYECTKCGHQEKDVHAPKRFTHELEEEKKKDSELLQQYREQFCLNDEEGKVAVDVLEQMKFANEVYTYELSKYSDPAREKSFQVKKLNISELERLLNSKLLPEGYRKLSFGRVVIEKFVIVPFSIQDTESDRTAERSIQCFIATVNDLLENTNWRLMIDSTSYHLGYLSGRFKGHEREEDITSLFEGKQKQKVTELDPIRRDMYGHSNLVRLFITLAQFHGKELLRKRKLNEFPEGYFLESEDDNNFKCSICDQWHRGRDTWYAKYGMRCDICQMNIQNGVILPKLCKYKKCWFSSEDIRYRYGIRASTMRKLIRLGELKGIELKDIDGKTYLTVFLKKDNKEFLEKYPEKEFSIPFTYRDEQGREIRL